MDREVLRGILDRSPVSGDGRSGAVLERVSLADGSRLVVKHFDPTVDLVMCTPGRSFTEEESFVSGDRAVVRWRYAWDGAESGHVRGVDVLRFREALVCEKLSYVKD